MAPSPTLIREFAAEAGFDLVRFGPADPGPHGDRFAEWLEAGRAGEMDYLAQNAEKIRNPTSWAPGVRSAISLAYDYGTADPVRIEGGGRIARYARGRDYHRFLGKATKRIRAFLESEGVPHGDTKVGTDAVPILERALATRAGLGFLAKSSGVIAPAHGPYLFLSEVLTSLELPFDDPASGTCGTCTRCIDACPTSAIVAPHELDARRCLSYTTIELRGSIPTELRKAQGDWLFGCDVCLEVCPFTRHGRSGDADATLPPELQPHPAIESFALVGILELTEAEWEEQWVGTAIRRARRTGMRRNAAVVLGNLGDGEALPALERALADDDPIVRGHAAWAIGEIDPRSGALDARLRAENDETVVAELRGALARR